MQLMYADHYNCRGSAAAAPTLNIVVAKKTTQHDEIDSDNSANARYYDLPLSAIAVVSVIVKREQTILPEQQQRRRQRRRRRRQRLRQRRWHITTSEFMAYAFIALLVNIILK